MTHHRESIDETIDRVAAQLTMAPADPARAGRIAEQVERDAPFAWPRLVMASVAVAALVVAVVLLKNTREADRADIARTAAPASSPEVSRPRDDAPRTRDATSLMSAALTAQRVRPAAEPALEPEPLPEMPEIESLQSPVTLAVDTLPTDTLTIAPVDLASLDVADLAVSEIGERASPKE
jgi:hypothetical protein